MQREGIETKIVRLEERMVALDQKIDFAHEQNDKQHEMVAKELSKLSSLIEQTALHQSNEIRDNKKEIDKNTKQIFEHHDKIQTFERDKKWVIGLLGLMWALFLAYIEFRIHK